MGNFWAAAKRVIVIGYLIALHAIAVWLFVDKFVLPRIFSPDWEPGSVQQPKTEPHVTPVTLPSVTPSPAPEPIATLAPPEISLTGKLAIPVKGVTPAQLSDTFADSRSETRTHDAIDIPAPAGTPVIAAADGEILRFYDSQMGGITIYQISADRKYFFYYAHLQSRAAGISEKQYVTKGTTIGYVGDTGNAGAGNFHLHFSISVVVDPNRFWEGISINPYPILKGEARLQ